ncbi:MAG: quinolinate synthase NadA, partial [Hyphomicrobium denitrificans]|nr:quinolinate synthase NadA [Hyphomicrobium denitrificans]
MVQTLERLAKPATASHPAAKAVPPYSWSKALEAELAPLYARVQHVVAPMEWPHYAPLIKAINELKQQRNAVILAHNYMTPEIFHCVADFRGDSLQLAKEAARV